MAHFLSIAFFASLIVSLGVFLAKMSRGNRWAIRAALVGTWITERLAETPLGRIGNCLRSSFPTAGQEPLSDDMNRLMQQLSTSDE